MQRKGSKIVLVIVEGGIVQEVTATPGQSWDVWDADDFTDAPIEYWEGLQTATQEHIRDDWPAMYGEIMKVYKRAQREEEEEQRAAAAQMAERAAAVIGMN